MPPASRTPRPPRIRNHATVLLHLYAADDRKLTSVRAQLVFKDGAGFTLGEASFPTHVDGERVASFGIDAPGHPREERHPLPG